MSEKMASRKKSTSSTDSSSGTTSDSSSNSSSSSSGSDSGSSSSDSDSSSSQDGPAPPSNSNNNNNTGGQATSSQAGTTNRGSTGSASNNPITHVVNTNQAKQADKNIRRKSSEVVTAAAKIQHTGSHGSDKIVSAKLKDNRKEPPSVKLSSKAVPNYSSDDDIVSTKSAPHKPVHDKKKPQHPPYKSKPVHVPTNIVVPANTGGKAPPAVVKQAKLSNTKIPTSLPQGAGAVKKPVEKSSSNSSNSSKNNTNNKKKSIFSPENSSESDDDDEDDDDDDDDDIDEDDRKPVQKIIKTQKTISVTKAISGGNKNLPRAKDKTSISNSNNQQANRLKSQKPAEKEKIVIKSSESSESTSSSVTSTSSESESESSADSLSPPPKKSGSKKSLQKPTVKTTDTSKNNSDSDNENATKPSIVRKLTRSASTRKSRHLTGKAPTDSDSDADSVKRSISKSPVKKAPVATKGKTKNKRVDMKNTENSIKHSPPIPEERKCPFEGCDSAGHLGGQFEKHFTIDACPMYHNMTLAQTKDLLHERKKREEDRKIMMILLNDPLKKQTQMLEQKMYLQKIKEIRMKFKPNPPEKPTGGNNNQSSSNPNNNNNNNNNTSNNNVSIDVEKTREPVLNGLVSDYDLQLFREAQAISSENIEDELKKLSPSKGTKYISMGKYCMEVWYQSPYPADAARLPKLYICEFCLRYQKSEVGMKRHAAKCVWRHPPGDEIYRKGKLGVWQVDGKRHKQYCQHLCLLAKFFLDHKTLYYDVEPFLFYVMTLADSEGCHTVGYFSKEKNSFLNYNVSCILTLPPYQRKGYGRLLIDFSYLLTRVEGKIGSPEKPLSDLGLISYRSYWKDVLLDYLCSRSGTALSIKDVSQEMAINSYDIVSTLQALGMMKYWKGKHIILKKQDVLEEYAERIKNRGHVLKIDPECLRWTPFVPPAPTTGPS